MSPRWKWNLGEMRSSHRGRTVCSFPVTTKSGAGCRSSSSGTDPAVEGVEWNPEWSRRGRGVATYAALRQLGRSGLAELIDRTCRYAHALVTRIGGLPGAEVVWEPVINQDLVRFLDPRPAAENADHDRRTDEVIRWIVAGGDAFFGGTTWRANAACASQSAIGARMRWTSSAPSLRAAVLFARQHRNPCVGFG